MKRNSGLTPSEGRTVGQPMIARRMIASSFVDKSNISLQPNFLLN
jgi:hypothetical protein